jgi:hypothetical protein
MLAGGTEDKEHAMSQKLDAAIAVIGIDIGKNSFHIATCNCLSTWASEWGKARRGTNLPAHA